MVKNTYFTHSLHSFIKYWFYHSKKKFTSLCCYVTWYTLSINHFDCFNVSDPGSVELNIDGSTDKCSKGEDINFIFAGFTLSGKVNFITLSMTNLYLNTHALQNLLGYVTSHIIINS